jgi:prepilin-type N-terminal cleavage/methylation domain-containing protein
MLSSQPTATRLRGVTLIELLVVVAILAILLAVSLTILRPVMKEMKVREASRMLNAYLAGVQARAVELDRPVAAYFEVRRYQSSADVPMAAAYQVFYAESPPPYAGDMAEARIIVEGGTTVSGTHGPVSLAYFDGAGTETPNNEFDDPESSAALTRLCEVGDLIRFDFKGPWYEIKDFNVEPNKPGVIYSTLYYGAPPAGTVPYQILRKPRKSMVAPLDMPTPMIVDVGSSGVGLSGAFYQNQQVTTEQTVPLIISFSPQGGIDRVYVGFKNPATGLLGYDVQRPAGAVHLLIGWVDKLGDLNGDTIPDNLVDGGNRWVSIGNVTGRITTSENAGIDGITGDNPYAKARSFAKDAQGMGGGGA